MAYAKLKLELKIPNQFSMTEKPKTNALPEKLYGADLLARVKALQEKKKKPTIKEMARSCGYLHRDTGGEQVTEFQRELLIASGVIEYPSNKLQEAAEPLKVGALYKIYNAKSFLSQMGLKDGDQIEYKIRKTKNGPVAELTPLPKPPRQEMESAAWTSEAAVAKMANDVESIEDVDLEKETKTVKALSLLPLAPSNGKEVLAG